MASDVRVLYKLLKLKIGPLCVTSEYYQLSILYRKSNPSSEDINMMQTIENDTEEPHIDFSSEINDLTPSV